LYVDLVINPGNYAWVDASTSGNWSGTSNWTTGVPGSSGNIGVTANFPSLNEGPLSINLDISPNLTGLSFTSTDNISINTIPGNAFTFANGSNTSNISVTIGNVTVAPNAAVSTGGLAFNVANGSVLTMSGNISGAGAALTKTGNGILKLSGYNTYDGGLTLNNGELDLNTGGNVTASPLGTGNFTVNATGNGTQLNNSSGSSVTIGTNNAIALNASNLTFVGSNNLDLGTGNVTVVSMTASRYPALVACA